MSIGSVRCRALGLVAVASCLGGLAACSSGGADVSVRPFETAPPVTTPPAAVGLTVVDPGAEPRQVLAYTWAAGTTEQATVTSQQSSVQTLNGQASPQNDNPPVQVTLQSEIQSIDGGTASVHATTTDVQILEENPGDATLGVFTPIMGLFTDSHIDDHGKVVDSVTEGNGDLDPLMADTVQGVRELTGQGALELPSEAVGVGAEWTFGNDLDQLGLTIRQTTTYRIAAIEGSTVSLSVELAQQVVGGELAIPGVPETATQEVTAWTITGSGEATVDLGRFYPELDVALHGEHAFRITPMADPVTVLTQTITETRQVAPV